MEVSMCFSKIRLVMLLGLVLPAYVTAADSLSIGQLFHRQTSFSASGSKADKAVFGVDEPLYKQMKWSTKVALPVPKGLSDMPVSAAIDSRRSVRQFADQPLSLSELSRLLVSADGITRSSGTTTMRAAPSAGALYPGEIYLVVKAVDSLPPGIYHFDVSDTSLQFLQPGDLGEQLNAAANGQRSVGRTPVTLVLTSRFARVTHKYADRGYRYAYMEAGAIAENIYLQTTALGLGTVMAGAFNDDAVNGLLGIDGTDEAALIIMPVGHLMGEGSD